MFILFKKIVLFYLFYCNSLLAKEVCIFVNPKGNDIYQGNTVAEAVRTIQRAINIAKITPMNVSKVEISLSSGIYETQKFEAKGNLHGLPILITTEKNGHAVFDGMVKGGTWMTLKPRGGNPSNISIKGVEVKNYETAIDIKGDRNNHKIWAGSLVVRDSNFSNIGDISRANAKPSTAAIRLVNSDNTIIVNNIFKNIKNNTNYGLLHAIYIAHDSTNNFIAENSFNDSCGDAIRFRDQSNDNVVRNNKFTDSWSRSPVSDWFCNPTQHDNCTKKSGECPSYNNLVELNKVIALNPLPVKVFIPYGGKPPLNCPPAPSASRGVVR